MKTKQAILSLAVMFILALAPLSSAQEIQQIESSPGPITPESGSFLYGIDTAIENIRLQLSNNPNAGLEIAEEKLAEIAVMNNSESVSQANQQREKALSRAMNKTRTDSEVQNVQEATQKHINVLQGLQETLPQEAQQGLQTALDNSQRFQDNIENAEPAIPEEVPENAPVGGSN